MSAQPTPPTVDPAESSPHHDGGQAVLEGVMMRGLDRWAIAVRRPGGDLWLESHPVADPPDRRSWLRLPLVRGWYALAVSLSIGSRAVRIAAHRAVDDGGTGEDRGDRFPRDLPSAVTFAPDGLTIHLADADRTEGR